MNTFSRFFICSLFILSVGSVFAQKGEEPVKVRVTIMPNPTLVGVGDSGEEFSDQKKEEKQKVFPFSIKVKLGVPNLASIGVAYNFKGLGNRVEPYIDVLPVPKFYQPTFTSGSLTYKHSYVELGVNFYLSKKGKGLYLSLSHGVFNLDYDYHNVQTVNVSYNQIAGFSGIPIRTQDVDLNYKAKGNVRLAMFNAKLGYKVGRKFFFIVEIGYAVGVVPTTFTATGVSEEQSIKSNITVDLKDELNDKLKPFVSSTGYLTGNIGFGIAF